jgi:hypothetical protein
LVAGLNPLDQRVVGAEDACEALARTRNWRESYSFGIALVPAHLQRTMLLSALSDRALFVQCVRALGYPLPTPLVSLEQDFFLRTNLIIFLAGTNWLPVVVIPMALFLITQVSGQGVAAGSARYAVEWLTRRLQAPVSSKYLYSAVFSVTFCSAVLIYDYASRRVGDHVRRRVKHVLSDIAFLPAESAKKLTDKLLRTAKWNPFFVDEAGIEVLADRVVLEGRDDLVRILEKPSVHDEYVVRMGLRRYVESALKDHLNGRPSTLAQLQPCLRDHRPLVYDEVIRSLVSLHKGGVSVTELTGLQDQINEGSYRRRLKFRRALKTCLLDLPQANAYFVGDFVRFIRMAEYKEATPAIRWIFIVSMVVLCGIWLMRGCSALYTR